MDVTSAVHRQYVAVLLLLCLTLLLFVGVADREASGLTEGSEQFTARHFVLYHHHRLLVRPGSPVRPRVEDPRTLCSRVVGAVARDRGSAYVKTFPVK
jgi:hypothetical protein